MANLQKLMQMAQITNTMNESNMQADRLAQSDHQQRVAAAMQLMGLLQEQQQRSSQQQIAQAELGLRQNELASQTAAREAQTGQSQGRNLIDALQIYNDTLSRGGDVGPIVNALRTQPGLESIGTAEDQRLKQNRSVAMEQARGMLGAVKDPAMRESLRPTLAQYPGAFDELVGQMFPTTQVPAGAVSQAYPQAPNPDESLYSLISRHLSNIKPIDTTKPLSGVVPGTYVPGLH